MMEAVSVWEYQDTSGFWTPHSPENCAILEKGYEKDETVIRLRDKFKVFLTTDSWFQVDITAQSKSKIRRSLYPLDSAPGVGASWGWVDMGKIKPYSMEVQCVLENLYSMGWDDVNLGIHFVSFSYIVDFKSMSTTNTNTGFKRDVKRVEDKQNQYKRVKLEPDEKITAIPVASVFVTQGEIGKAKQKSKGLLSSLSTVISLIGKGSSSTDKNDKPNATALDIPSKPLNSRNDNDQTPSQTSNFSKTKANVVVGTANGGIRASYTPPFHPVAGSKQQGYDLRWRAPAHRTNGPSAEPSSQGASARWPEPSQEGPNARCMGPSQQGSNVRWTGPSQQGSNARMMGPSQQGSNARWMGPSQQEAVIDQTDSWSSSGGSDTTGASAALNGESNNIKSETSTAAMMCRLDSISEKLKDMGRRKNSSSDLNMTSTGGNVTSLMCVDDKGDTATSSNNSQMFKSDSSQFGNMLRTHGDLVTLSKKSEEECCICCEPLWKESPYGNSTNAAVKLKCKHILHVDCVRESNKANANDSHITCPICKTVHGEVEGRQPKGGRMITKIVNNKLPGFSCKSTIVITYEFSPGTQGPEHPNPGRPYSTVGFPRIAYLPNNQRGQQVLSLLSKAFDRRLIFTIGQSATTGRKDTLTWNDIHHKTSMSGGSSNYGYPDDTYLDRVTKELQAQGIE